jgi:hypothetical protein
LYFLKQTLLADVVPAGAAEFVSGYCGKTRYVLQESGSSPGDIQAISILDSLNHFFSLLAISACR